MGKIEQRIGAGIATGVLLAGCGSAESMNRDPSNEPRLVCSEVVVDLGNRAVQVSLTELDQPAVTPPDAQVVLGFDQNVATQSVPLDLSASGVARYIVDLKGRSVASATVINTGPGINDAVCGDISVGTVSYPTNEYWPSSGG